MSPKVLRPCCRRSFDTSTGKFSAYWSAKGPSTRSPSVQAHQHHLEALGAILLLERLQRGSARHGKHQVAKKDTITTRPDSWRHW